MNQHKNDAAQPAREDDAIEVEAQTLRRLETIRTPDESCDDTLNRLLDEAVKNVPITKILKDLLNQFENTVSVNVHMSTRHESPGMLIISVHTGEVGFEEDVTLYEGKEARAVIESQAGGTFHLPFDVIATCDGPKRETIETTPVYVTDSVLGLEPVPLDEGLDQLRTKIGKSNDELRELIYDH